MAHIAYMARMAHRTECVMSYATSRAISDAMSDATGSMWANGPYVPQHMMVLSFHRDYIIIKRLAAVH